MSIVRNMQCTQNAVKKLIHFVNIYYSIIIFNKNEIIIKQLNIKLSQ